MPSRATNAVDREGIAQALYHAYREHTLVTAPSVGAPDFAPADASAIAERLRELRIAGGDTPAGYKVGFTNQAVRDQFGAYGLLSATVYTQTLCMSPAVDAGTLLLPRIEPEVVVGIGADGEIAWAALGFEIVQSHVAEWKFTFLDAVADFGLHAALVIGDRQAVDARQLERLLAMRVQLRRNGDIVETGAGSDVDGGVRGSIAWLRDDLRQVNRELHAGEVVSTGSMTRVPPIASGERWTIEALDAELAPLTLDVR